MYYGFVYLIGWGFGLVRQIQTRFAIRFIRRATAKLDAWLLLGKPPSSSRQESSSEMATNTQSNDLNILLVQLALALINRERDVLKGLDNLMAEVIDLRVSANENSEEIKSKIIQMENTMSATKQEFLVVLGKIDTATTAVGTKISTLTQQLKDALEAKGLDLSAEAEIFAALNTSANALTAIAADPENPVPTPEPTPEPA
jgi:hypothetical protein